nr:BON domain-containing protein [uncultured Desulfuromonas sp.]
MKAKGERAKKVIYAIPVVIAALTLLTFSLPVQAVSTDSRIESAAKTSYVFTNYLKDDDVKVQSKDGAVTLTGSVASESHQAMAGETVANLPGVKAVDNQLTVKGNQPSAMSDAWLVTKVKTNLLFHRSVSATTDVDVKDGIVTLRGTADNQAQKELTTEYATDVDGVKEVKNEMIAGKSSQDKQTIGDKIDDASITTMVKMTLLGHRSTSAFKTSVTTKDGVVTLSGKADNQAEIALAGKLANDVNGVQSVQNKMTVR